MPHIFFKYILATGSFLSLLSLSFLTGCVLPPDYDDSYGSNYTRVDVHDDRFHHRHSFGKRMEQMERRDHLQALRFEGREREKREFLQHALHERAPIKDARPFLPRESPPPHMHKFHENMRPEHGFKHRKH